MLETINPCPGLALSTKLMQRLAMSELRLSANANTLARLFSKQGPFYA